jgi:uncharacterized protein (TIGR03067 family)
VSPPSARRVADLADPGGAYVWSPWVSEDGLTIYGETQRGGGKTWIWTARRKDVLSPFADKKFVHEGRHPCVRRDGLEMIYAVQGKLVSARRPSLDQPFGPPTELANVNQDKQAMPSMSSDGLTLVFQRAGPVGQPWPAPPFHMAQRKTLDSPWQESKPLPIKASVSFDNRLSWPTLFHNGLTLLCGHEPLGARPAFMVWSRANVNEPFGQPRYLEGPFPAGRCPRWIPATRELFFFAPATAAEASASGWVTGDIWVVKPFDLPPTSTPAAAKTDEDLIQGPWRAVAGEFAGIKLPADDLKGFKFEFKDDSLKLKLRMGKESFNVEGNFTLDSRKEPKKFNFIMQKEPLLMKGAKSNVGKALHGIYRFKGEQLELCFTEAADPRPSEFTTNKNTPDQFLLLFERDLRPGQPPKSGK